MSPETKRTWEVVVGLVVGLASVGATLVAYDAQLDGRILGPVRPRLRWAWRAVTSTVASTWHGPEIAAGAERACAESPWRPTWNRLHE